MNAAKITSLLKNITKAGLIKIIFNGEEAFVGFSTSDINGIYDNEVLRLYWSSVDEDYSVIITEQGLDEAAFYDNIIELTDHEGDNVTLKLFDLVPAYVKINWENDKNN